MSQIEKIIGKLTQCSVSYNRVNHAPVTTMADVVRVLSLPDQAMAKTVLLKVQGVGLVAVVIPGMYRVDFGAVARTLGLSRKGICLADAEVLQRHDIEPGTASPLCDGFSRVIVDSRLLNQKEVYCGIGDKCSTLVVNPKDIVAVTSAAVADVSKQ